MKFTEINQNTKKYNHVINFCIESFPKKANCKDDIIVYVL